MFELTDGREALYQWDTGRMINVDSACTQLHFSNVEYGVSVDVDVDAETNTAKIPDALLTVHGLLYVYGFIGSSGNGYTKVSQVFDVKPRPKPADYVYTEDELKTYEELEAKIQEIDGQIANLQTEFAEQIANTQNELSGQISDVQTNLSAQVENVHTELSKQISSAKSELEGIRTAADGTTYETAGEAVRTQVNELKTVDDELKGDLNKIGANYITYGVASQNRCDSNELESGMLDRNTGKVDSTNASAITTGFIPIPQAVGEYVTVTLRLGPGAIVRINSTYRMCFYNENREFISGSGYASKNEPIAKWDGASYVRASVDYRALNIMVVFNDGTFSTDVNDYEEYAEGSKIINPVPVNVSGFNNDSDYIKRPELESDYDVRKNEYVHCSGDSLTNGTGATNIDTSSLAYRGYPIVLQNLITDGKIVINDGVGGDKIEEIACRQGGIEMFAEPFTIPSDTTGVEVVFTVSDGTSATSFKMASKWNPLTIAGVVGNVSYDSETKTYTFTRNEAGEDVVLTRPEKVYANYTSKKGILVIFAGSNNMLSADTVPNYYQYYDNMISWNGNDKYIIIGMTSQYYMSEVAEVNKMLAKRYGYHFLDIRTYMLNYGLEDEGITPTEQDLIDIASGEIPESLRTNNADGTKDTMHFNQHGYNIIGTQLYKKGVALGYWA